VAHDFHDQHVWHQVEGRKEGRELVLPVRPAGGDRLGSTAAVYLLLLLLLVMADHHELAALLQVLLKPGL
jgi:hypothetical protein